VMEVRPQGLVVMEIMPGYDFDAVQAATEATLSMAV